MIHNTKITLFLVCLLLSLSALGKTCENHIEKAICLVNPPQDEVDRYRSGRKCLKTPKKYKKLILDTYKIYPKFIQNKICNLDSIYVEKDFFGGAWSALSDKGRGLIGIRQLELDSNPTLEKFDSWFEQQTFGGLTNFQVQPNLPIVKIKPEGSEVLSFLVKTFLHEIGHIIDYENNLNSIDCNEKTDECRASAGSWTEISWENYQQPKFRYDFILRKKICLNNCNGDFIPRNSSKELYENIFKNGFVSQLGSLNAMEDFAESFTYYVLRKHLGITFSIQDHNYLLSEFLDSPAFQEKLHFLRARF